MSKIVVTGGAGFIGSELSHFLAKKGHDVFVIYNLSYGHISNLTKNNSSLKNFFKLDARDKDMDKVLNGADCVFHFAAIAPLPDNQRNPQKSVQNNIESTANVLELSRKAGVKHFILASTGAVYENNYDDVLTEDLQVCPDLIYAVSKVCAEEITKSYNKCFGLPTTILRFFNVYGPHQDFQRLHPPLMAYIARELFLGRQPQLHSNGEQKRDYVHINDVIKLCESAMLKSAAYGQTFNVCTGETASVNDINNICSSEMKSSIKPVYRESERLWDSYEELFDGVYPLNRQRIKKETEKFSCGSFDKAKTRLGWTPQIKLEHGVRSTIKEMLPIIEENYRTCKL